MLQRKIKTVAKNIFPLSYCYVVPFSIPCHLETLIEFFHSKSRLYDLASTRERLALLQFFQQCDDASNENYFAICSWVLIVEGCSGVEFASYRKVKLPTNVYTSDQNISMRICVCVWSYRRKGVHNTPKY